jgi:hypothetical protein
MLQLPDRQPVLQINPRLFSHGVMKDNSNKSRWKGLLYQRVRDTFELSPVVPRDEAESFTPEVCRHATWVQDVPSEAELGVQPSFAHYTPAK